MDDSSNVFTMPVAPAYSNGGGFGGFGGDGWWIILLLLCGWGGFGGGFGGGYGNMMLGYDFPWLLNGQQSINNNVSGGFRDAQLSDGITSIRDGIGNLSTQLCGCCSDMQMALANGFAGVEQGANARQMASMQQNFGIQSAISNGFSNTAAATADLKYTIASEACADRAAVTSGVQAVLDKLCQLELDGYKREADNLRTQLSEARLAASQTAQNAFISQGFANEVDALYNRLNSCPVPTTPVYGRTPIFTCNNQSGCGCGCNGGF